MSDDALDVSIKVALAQVLATGDLAWVERGKVGLALCDLLRARLLDPVRDLFPARLRVLPGLGPQRERREGSQRSAQHFEGGLAIDGAYLSRQGIERGMVHGILRRL
jgi:hypothetical protein